MKYVPFLTGESHQISRILMDELPELDNCISRSGENIVVEVSRNRVADAIMCLHKHFRDVVDIRNAYKMINDLHDFVLVKPLVSEAPVYEYQGVYVPTIEKRLVDMVSDGENKNKSEDYLRLEYQKAFEAFDINTKKMLRYADRKGEKEQVLDRMKILKDDRIELVKKIQSFFVNQPVVSAWIFGSFSRMEETPHSDLDILFVHDKNVKFSLMDHAGITLALESITGREVDLVEVGTLMPYAEKTASCDKYQIYERGA